MGETLIVDDSELTLVLSSTHFINPSRLEEWVGLATLEYRAICWYNHYEELNPSLSMVSQWFIHNVTAAWLPLHNLKLTPKIYHTLLTSRFIENHPIGSLPKLMRHLISNSAVLTKEFCCRKTIPESSIFRFTYLTKFILLSPEK